MRFQTDFQRKPIIMERQSSQNVTVFMLGTTCFYNWIFVKKRTKREISGRFSVKTPYNKATIFSKRNGILVFRCFFVQKKNKT